MAAAIILWTALYPVLMIGSYLFEAGGLANNLQGSSLLVDVTIVYPFWLGIILAAQVTFFFIVIDATRLLLFPLYRKHRERWLQVQSWAVVALVSIGAIYVIARFYNDTFTSRTRETEVQIAGLPQQLDGLRIVHLADLQADPRTRDGKLDRYVERVNNLNPDLILFAGDLVTSGLDYIETGAQAIGRMQANYGKYACLGDHDFFSNRQRVKENLEKNGVTVLDNTATVVPIGSSYVSITGITNVYPSRPAPSVLATIEEQRLRGPVNIFLVHQPSPDITRYAADRNYDLFLGGHTHGGQIVFPLPGFLLAAAAFETDYVTGFYKIGSMFISINNGLGMTLAPVRYHAPAEVTLIQLRNGAGD
jgi:predicted MPP superfamily phosphohydrolase